MACSGVVHVIDDEAPVRRSLERLLRASGVDVRTYASAEEFLAVADEYCCGRLLLDHQMPGLSGLELQRVLADHGNWQVVFLTGYADFGTSEEARAAGAVEVLMKPAPRDAILDALERARVRCEAQEAGCPPGA